MPDCSVARTTAHDLMPFQSRQVVLREGRPSSGAPSVKFFSSQVYAMGSPSCAEMTLHQSRSLT